MPANERGLGGPGVATTEFVTSKDGTRIAFDRTGVGPPIIIVAGAIGNRSFGDQLGPLLAPHLTVYNYDRRGRNESGDTPPYAVEREVEDIEALIKEAVSAGRRGDALEIFMTKAVGLPAEFVTGMRSEPMWPGLEAVAHTIAYDGAIMEGLMAGKLFPPERARRWSSITVPTLVLVGGATWAVYAHGGAGASRSPPERAASHAGGTDARC